MGSTGRDANGDQPAGDGYTCDDISVMFSLMTSLCTRTLTPCSCRTSSPRYQSLWAPSPAVPPNPGHLTSASSPMSQGAVLTHGWIISLSWMVKCVGVPRTRDACESWNDKTTLYLCDKNNKAGNNNKMYPIEMCSRSMSSTETRLYAVVADERLLKTLLFYFNFYIVSKM